jgi:rare lipoprotein A
MRVISSLRWSGAAVMALAATLVTPAAPRDLTPALAHMDVAAAPRPAAPVYVGNASWYGRWHHGRRTASGERFNMWDLTAAHRTLPLGTRVRVTNLNNGRSVDVRVNDRGPHIDDRIIDLSRAAAVRLDAEQPGVVPVTVVVLARFRSERD